MPNEERAKREQRADREERRLGMLFPVSDDAIVIEAAEDGYVMSLVDAETEVAQKFVEAFDPEGTKDERMGVLLLLLGRALKYDFEQRELDIAREGFNYAWKAASEAAGERLKGKRGAWEDFVDSLSADEDEDDEGEDDPDDDEDDDDR